MKCESCGVKIMEGEEFTAVVSAIKMGGETHIENLENCVAVCNQCEVHCWMEDPRTSTKLN